MSRPTTDGWIAFVRRDCPTCGMLEEVLARLVAERNLTVYSQDDPSFPEGAGALGDDELEHSFRHRIETVPTLLWLENGQEEKRLIGWDRQEWAGRMCLPDLGDGLPDHRPGCGSLSAMPGISERLEARFGDRSLASRRLQVGALEDEIEACFDRGWTDGLPVVPPTEERVVRMLAGTERDRREIVGLVPPDNAECSIEKVAINAVMAGCRPEYLPVVLAAVEAALLDEFCLHGVVATTYFSGPVAIVNGPIVRAVGMEPGINALGQGNRANATIGRALQLVVRNVGGGRPGEVDRATLGFPGKVGFCFAEAEAGSPWESLAVERGFGAEDSTVTLFAGGGVQGLMDQRSRRPESLARSFAAALAGVAHPKLAMAADAVLVVSPEHARVFREAGWSKERLRSELEGLLLRPGSELVAGAGGIAEGIPAKFAEASVPKFRPGGLLIVHAGGTAGMFSAVIGGWPASGPVGSSPVTVKIEEGGTP